MNWHLTPQRVVLTLALALIVVFGGAWATASAARGSLPGDTLYPVKTALEEAQVAISQDAAEDARLELRFAELRLDEIERLLADGRYQDVTGAAGQFENHIEAAIQSLGRVAAGNPARAQTLALDITKALSRYNRALSDMLAAAPEPVRPALEQALKSSQQGEAAGEFEFVGVLLAIDGMLWQIDDQWVTITAETEIEGNIAIGDTVVVEVIESADGTLTALEIERVEEDDDGNENDDDDGNANDDDDGNANDDDDGNADDDDDDDGNANDDDDGNADDDDEGNANDDDDGNENDDDDGNANDDDDGNENDDDDDGNENDDDDDGNENDDDDDGNENDDDDGNENDDDDDGNENDD